MRNESLYERGFLVHYDDGTNSLHRTPLNYLASINDVYHTISEGESLLDIAQFRYGDPFLWYVIADTNPDIIEDIFILPVGSIIVIPDLDLLDAIYG